jgi:3-oxoacyl-[acyl-carrier-protein] synthase II
VVSARGRGIGALDQALVEGWRAPIEVEVRGAPGGRLPIYAVAPETMADKTALAKARRADRFTRMAVLAACDAVQDSGLGGTLDRSRLGVIVATALGPHATTFSFLDGILDFGDAAVSPTAFSHSVHNAAASYIAMTLDVRGPTLTLTHFDFAFQQAVLLAQAWMDQQRCDAVLVGAVDELGAVLQYACGHMLKTAADGRIKPFGFSAAPEVVPGEGSVFFLMTREAAGAAYARAGKTVGTEPDPPEDSGILEGRPPCRPPPVLQILDTGGLSRNETAYRTAVAPGMTVAAYAPIFGSIMTGSAFHAAVAALMLKRQRCYACPVVENPHGLPLCLETAPAEIGRVLCTHLDCAGKQTTIVWERL